MKRSIIVTGGASGIGKAAAEQLARTGCAVTIADVQEAHGHAVVDAINHENIGHAQFVHTDVSDANSVRAMVARVLSAYGRLDGAINCAGVPQTGKMLSDLTPEEWDFCTGINLRGGFLCMKYEIEAMLPQKKGAIVAISSAAATLGLPKSSDYCASKAGLAGMVRAAAVDYSPLGIRINALLPGATLTPLAAKATAMNPGFSKSLAVPIGRWAQPDEIAAGAVWLLSEGASYVTGACIAIDGGMAII